MVASNSAQVSFQWQIKNERLRKIKKKRLLKYVQSVVGI